MRTWAGEYVKQGRELGRKEGRAEGKAEGRVEGRVEGKAKGRAEGKAEALLQVLTVRGVRVSKTARERILACEDLRLLGLWMERALTASRLSEVFGTSRS